MKHGAPPFQSALAVCAHPDDESFGLGAVLSTLADAGTRVSVLCFTRGEASTLHQEDEDLAAVRSRELVAAARSLGIAQTELLDYPDGGLDAQPLDELAGHVVQIAGMIDADVLVTFDRGGITGHPDHEQATQASLVAARMLEVDVLAWAVPETVADTLNREFGATFVGRLNDECDILMTVDRAKQFAAIADHRSQSSANPVLWRRLDLLGDHEHLRYLS